VVKSVSTGVDKVTYMKGNVDIAMEAKYLSALYHRNIIELAAVSSAKPCTTGYFIVLERMEETLGTRLKKWMDTERMNTGVMGCFGGSKNLERLYVERIEASYDIASAMYYLHSKNIMYRDLKPDNIGFDRVGVLKLFDFGLAKELDEDDQEADGTYRNMTAMTGAIRYMAPEVGLGDSYNLAADVYAWSMLMWFILALEPPFGLYTEDMIMNCAWRKGHRPVIFKRWNKNIQRVLKSSWDSNISKRPSFMDIVHVLKQELVDCDASKNLEASVATSDSSDPTDQD
jgi:serine/threonine protein kinase